MALLTGSLALAIATATATTFDDNIYLTLFFGRVNQTFRPRHIVVGEFVGFTALVGVSLVGFLGGLVVSHMWIGLLGFLPIAIGVNTLLSRDENDGETIQDTSPNLSRRCSYPCRSKATVWKTICEPQTYRVAAVTIANGGNNIGIYIPLFASSTLPNLVLTLSVCYTAIGLWCLLSYSIVRRPAIAFIMARYVRKVVPFVLMWIGFSILLDNQSYQLLAGLF
ncbi:cadmium resistance transporter [Leptolyngbya sp. AN02str]|uniref:cadmium resistance transporter n=1 Tax=Leptolyngbya sp. AN02str TaxID=3423363 RepID=UPI003D31EE45